MTKKPLKIAYIGQKGIPAQWGGVERATEELAVRMARLGHQVTAYCRGWYTKNEPKTYQGVTLVYTPSIHTKHLDTITHTFFSLAHALWNRADVIHFQGIGPALLSWIPRLISPHTRVLVSFHCIDRNLKKWNRIARAAFWFGEYITMKSAHEVFVTSRFIQDYCYQVWERQATYLPNGVFNDSVESTSPTHLKQFNVKPQEYVICVGRLMSDKAQHEVVESFKRMKDRASDEFAHMKLVIVGDSFEGDMYREALVELAENREDIVFTGTQTGIILKSLMCYARAAVQPSYSEGMPLVVLELAGYGIPLVLSDIPAHREIFGDAYAYVPVGDIERLSRNIEIIVRNFEDVRLVAQLQAARIAEHYRWEVIAARYQVSLVAMTAGAAQDQAIFTAAA